MELVRRPLRRTFTDVLLRFASVLSFDKAKAEREEADRTAADLFDRYGNRIYRLAYSYVHNPSDAEEILEDTILRYLEKRPKTATEEHRKAWLLRVAANLSKDRIRYNKVRETDELDENLKAEGHEDLSFVWEAVKTLPPKYSEAVHLYYYEGYSTAEIADILKRKESTVRSDLRRARIKLQELLGEAYDFGD